MIHDIKIEPIMRKLSAEIPRARPTPSTAPTSVCVVEMGSPVPEAMTTTVEAERLQQNPRLGVSSVIPAPTVAITLCPYMTRPATIPTAPRSNTR